MTFSALIAVITAFFQFPEAVSALVKSLQETPEEKQADLIAKVQAEVTSYKTPGSRPTWNP